MTTSTHSRQGRALALFALALALLLGWCALIAIFSAGTGDASQSLSDGVIFKLLSVLQPGFSQLPPEQQVQIVAAWSFPVRKLAHFSEYLVLCGLAINTLLRAKTVFPQLSGLSIARICIAAVAFCALYACGDEFHQLFVSGRAGRLFDVGVDTAGALACAAIFAAVRRFSRTGKHSAS
ncbi:MAG: VanZ family protein [Coriobacteriales bacterium]